ncbi:MAG: hypothetical protein KC420_22715, partial [Myxococcales bacterium]|nr:hypothetical protein [Myxococcales bacterium]
YERERAALHRRLGEAEAALAEEREAAARLQGSLSAAEDRLAGLKRQLADETDAHAATRRRHIEELEARREEERRQRKRRVALAIGSGVASVAAALLFGRRRG